MLKTSHLAALSPPGTPQAMESRAGNTADPRGSRGGTGLGGEKRKGRRHPRPLSSCLRAPSHFTPQVVNISLGAQAVLAATRGPAMETVFQVPYPTDSRVWGMWWRGGAHQTPET